MDEDQHRIERLDRFQKPDRRGGVDGFDLDHLGLTGLEIDRAMDVDALAPAHLLDRVRLVIIRASGDAITRLVPSGPRRRGRIHARSTRRSGASSAATASKLGQPFEAILDEQPVPPADRVVVQQQGPGDLSQLQPESKSTSAFVAPRQSTRGRYIPREGGQVGRLTGDKKPAQIMPIARISKSHHGKRFFGIPMNRGILQLSRVFFVILA